MGKQNSKEIVKNPIRAASFWHKDMLLNQSMTVTCTRLGSANTALIFIYEGYQQGKYLFFEILSL